MGCYAEKNSETVSRAVKKECQTEGKMLGMECRKVLLLQPPDLLVLGSDSVVPCISHYMLQMSSFLETKDHVS